MAEILDCKGMKCPKPILKLAIRAKTAPAGTSLEVHADCTSFASEVEKWCNDNGKVLVSLVERGDVKVATIQL